MSATFEHRPRERAVPMPGLLQPGRNCWRVDRAERFACIQDAADYFRLVRAAILEARDTVFIVGWDIQATVDLVPGGAPDDAPTRLDDLLRWVVRRRPDVRCYILTWDYAALYALERDPLIRWRLGWRMPRQVRFGLDDRHPFGGSHHQKIVVIDDALAFCGGIDLTGHRWDTSAHRVIEPARVNASGSPYGPYHEVQAVADGAVAASLGRLVRDRWHALGETPRERPSTPPRRLWPEGLEPDLTEIDVAIARTMPPSEREAAVRECEQLFVDSIRAAERTIYIESQYFTNDRLSRALADRLQEPDGPELLVVMPKACHGWLEQQTMCALRDQAIRQLTAVDRHHRLRLVYPAASRQSDVATFVHSKVMIVDDRFVRIGSANFSRRSMGVDTECDLAVDAGTDPRQCAGVRDIRARLLGEHLGMAPDAIAAETARLGSLRALVDARAHADRTLLPIDLSAPMEPPSELVKAAADPDAPLGTTLGTTGMMPPAHAHGDRGPVRRWLMAVGTGVTALVLVRNLPGVEGVVRRELLESPQALPSLWLGVAAFAAAQLFLPLELLAMLAGLVLGGIAGGIVALVGALLAAIAGYAVGRAWGTERVAARMRTGSYQSTRQLGAQGVVGTALLRLTSIASARDVHLVSGTASAPFGTYLAGSLLGLAPVILAWTGVGALLRGALLAPGWSAGLLAAGVLGAGALAYGLRSLLVMRHLAASGRRQRERAEFG